MQVLVTEDGDDTFVRAASITGGGGRVEGLGRARRNPSTPETGNETAMARATARRDRRDGCGPALRRRHFDAAMTTFSVHQWSDLRAGLREMRRVARGPVIVLTYDPDRVRDFRLYAYAPLVLDTETRRYPPIADIADALCGHVTVEAVPSPIDCRDGFGEAYYARPGLLLDPGARRANSAWSFVPEDVAEQYVDLLRRDLRSGAWDERYGALRAQPSFDGSLVLLRSVPVRGTAGAPLGPITTGRAGIAVHGDEGAVARRVGWLSSVSGVEQAGVAGAGGGLGAGGDAELAEDPCHVRGPAGSLVRLTRPAHSSGRASVRAAWPAHAVRNVSRSRSPGVWPMRMRSSGK
ncbi:hypothetical protein ABZW11_12750 [Nonomuraea sp. NPDC004580]|uniref:hypothetical protein n=1 Tax=Nonomuraea sp. NPDC004580 TaxID=3154552 RepID=UPI0033ABD5AB